MTSFIIRDVRLFDGHNEIENGYVLVDFGKIISLAAGPPSSSSNIKTISKPGHTLLPGLIDAHNHLHGGNVDALKQALRFGVTTIMDLHNEVDSFLKIKKAVAEEGFKRQGADFKCAGIAATIENGWPVPVVLAHNKSLETLAEIAKWPRLRTEEDVKAYLKENTANGADYIKLMHESGAAMGAEFTKPSLSLQKTIIDLAHQAGKITLAHALAMNDHIEILSCGIDGLAHAFYDQPPTKELIEAYRRNNAFLNPTLAAIGSLTTEGRELAEKYAHDPRAEGKLGEAERKRMCQCMDFKTEGSKVEYAYEAVRQLKDAGIDIVWFVFFSPSFNTRLTNTSGSDSAEPAVGTAWGLSLHQELHLFVSKCGLTPLEALRSATSVTARRMNFDDRGRIAPGLNADLLLVEGNPMVEIDDTLNVRGVWREGVLAMAWEGEF
ncbi:hypothetical protein BLS_006952 [Venturia inaequalis]|uniref:Amidohydrolase-related domain-containing protein n=1 Tax=Venturia inaequalis TaxID=5025 RepID=A0A8H3VI34_VENIN|nr:hypothetical protein BLS_006952 [Venturia inaequalis]KAE9987304.1 hypothetical protein EG327_003880 [Venturia inaequalis]